MNDVGELSPLPWAELIDRTGAAIALSVDGRTLAYVSAAFARLYGATVDELAGSPIGDLFPPEQHASLAGGLERLRQGEHVAFETRRVRHDGSPLSVSCDLTSWVDPHGARYLALRLQDRTEHEHASPRALEPGAPPPDEPYRRLLGELLDLSVHEVYVLDPESMRFSLASAAALANLGYTLDELRALGPMDITDDFDAARARERIAPLLRGDRRMVTFSVQNRRKDGTTYPVLLRLQRVNLEGRAAVLAVGIDETERVAAQHAARERSELYRRLAENSRDAIFRCVLDAPQFEYWSPATREVLGFEAAEAIAHPHRVRERFGPQGQALLSTAKERVTKLGESATFEAPYQHPSGEQRWLLVRLRLARDDDGRPVAVEGSMTDITERKHAESEVRTLNAELEVRVADRTRDLEEANRALDAFAHAISHDLRAPLRAISGFAAVVLEEAGASLNAEARSAADRILAAAGRADRLTLDLLSLCQVDRHELRRSSCDLGAMARTVTEELAAETGRVVTVTIAEDMRADADAALVEVVVRNLVDNAWKYTRKTPSPRIEVGVESRDGERIFFVRDNGIGFDMGKVEYVFAPLERLHGIEEYEGTGLGLSMSKRIVERHGGRLWAAATPGRGATFYFTLAPAPGARERG